MNIPLRLMNSKSVIKKSKKKMIGIIYTHKNIGSFAEGSVPNFFRRVNGFFVSLFIVSH